MPISVQEGKGRPQSQVWVQRECIIVMLIRLSWPFVSEIKLSSNEIKSCGLQVHHSNCIVGHVIMNELHVITNGFYNREKNNHFFVLLQSDCIEGIKTSVLYVDGRESMITLDYTVDPSKASEDFMEEGEEPKAKKRKSTDGDIR